MSTAFLVFGPESSGTRLTTELLVRAGCQGRSDHHQPYDAFGPAGGDATREQVETFVAPDPKPDLLVWRRSFPHRGRLCQGSNIAQSVIRAGYDVHVVVCVRHWNAARHSQIDRHHTTVSLPNQYQHILHPLLYTGWAWSMAVYESFILGGLPALNAWLTALRLPSLPHLDGLELRDENAKWFA